MTPKLSEREHQLLQVLFNAKAAALYDPSGTVYLMAVASQIGVTSRPEAAGLVGRLRSLGLVVTDTLDTVCIAPEGLQMIQGEQALAAEQAARDMEKRRWITRHAAFTRKRRFRLDKSCLASLGFRSACGLVFDGWLP